MGTALWVILTYVFFIASFLLGIILIAPLIGLLLFVLLSLFQRLLFRIFFGVRLKYREAAAWLAWSLTPLAWISVLVLPILLGVFGLILFSTNPAPWNLLPLPFWMLTGLGVVGIVWSILLMPVGFCIHGPTYRTVLSQQAAIWLLLGGLIVAGAEILRATV